MASVTYPKNVIELANTMLRVWRETRPNMTFGDMTAQEFSEVVVDAEKERDALETAVAQVDVQRDGRDASHIKAWNYVKRGKAGFKSAFGDDSTEYERVGGTRRSNRKKPTRTPKNKPAQVS